MLTGRGGEWGREGGWERPGWETVEMNWVYAALFICFPSGRSDRYDGTLGIRGGQVVARGFWNSPLSPFFKEYAT